MQTMQRTGATEHKGMEYKLCFGEIKEFSDAKYQFGGYVNVKNNQDYGRDITRDGAFRKTLTSAFQRKAQGDPFLYPWLWNHSQDQLPPGGIYDADEDKHGMYARVQLVPEIQQARELFASLKAKTIQKSSMGYIASVVNWIKGEDGKGQVRELLEVDFKEGSSVIFAMNPLSVVDQVKRYWPGYSFQEEAKEGRVLSTRTVQVLRKATSGIESHVNDIQQHMTAMRMNAQAGFPVYGSSSSDETYDIASALAELNAMLEDKSGAAISEANHQTIAQATTNIMKHTKIIKDLVNEASRYNRLAGAPVYSASSDETFEEKEDPAITELRELRESLTPSSRSIESRMDELSAKINVNLAMAALLASE